MADDDGRFVQGLPRSMWLYQRSSMADDGEWTMQCPSTDFISTADEFWKDDGHANGERFLGITHWLSHTEMKFLADSGVSRAISPMNNMDDDSPLETGGMTFRLCLVARNRTEILHIDSPSLGGCVSKLREKNSEEGGPWEGILEGEMSYE